MDEVPLAVPQPFSATPAQQKAPGGTTAGTPSPRAVAAPADTAPLLGKSAEIKLPWEGLHPSSLWEAAFGEAWNSPAVLRCRIFQKS